MESKYKIKVEELEKRLKTVRGEIEEANSFCEKKKREEKRLKRKIDKIEEEWSLVRLYERYEGKYWKFSCLSNGGYCESTIIMFAKEIAYDNNLSAYVMKGTCVEDQFNPYFNSKTYFMKGNTFFEIMPLSDGKEAGVCYWSSCVKKKPTRLEPSSKAEFIAMATEGAAFVTSCLSQ